MRYGQTAGEAMAAIRPAFPPASFVSANNPASPGATSLWDALGEVLLASQLGGHRAAHGHRGCHSKRPQGGHNAPPTFPSPIRPPERGEIFNASRPLPVPQKQPTMGKRRRPPTRKTPPGRNSEDVPRRCRGQRHFDEQIGPKISRGDLEEKNRKPMAGIEKPTSKIHPLGRSANMADPHAREEDEKIG